MYIIGCGNYMDSTYGCPGRTLIPNIKMAAILSGVKPDEIYFGNCFLAPVKCPYINPEEIAKMIKDNFGVKVHSCDIYH